MLFGSCNVNMGGGTQFGVKHNSLLHGFNSLFCNFIRVSSAAVANKMVRDGRDLAEAGQRKALLPVQWVKVESGRRRKACLTFWDSGSNVIIRRKMALEAGWQGFPSSCSLMTTGGEPEDWQTTTYYVPIKARSGQIHRILSYKMEDITMALETFKLKPQV